SAEVPALPASTMPATIFESGETQSTLIELFTSEGCSSCPPAEAWLSKLKDNPDLWKHVVPVAFHVDYWNGLGWPDRFSRSEFTDRQRRYAAAWRIDSVYTPNFVINGREWKGWFNNGMLSAPSKKTGKLRVTLTDNIDIAATFESTQPGPLKLEVALLGTNLESDVKRGENSGRKLRHDFVVLDLIQTDMTKELSHWTGSIAFPKQPGDEKPSAIAVWITENATPIQATGGWLVGRIK
ncbi:MAG: DUF1223 domain-containing protein, partial [Chthoniobacterales bacterium]